MATVSAWDDILDDEAALLDAGKGGDPSEDGFLMAGGLKNASKCRSCAKTLDVGVPAWCVPFSYTTHL